jgi:prevent-host-death family protein
MKRAASVVEIKTKLSEYLRLVKAGHEIIITERGLPVARVVPLDEAERKSTRRTRLSRTGVVRMGRGRLPKLLQQAPTGPDVGEAVLSALLAERGDPDR